MNIRLIKAILFVSMIITVANSFHAHSLIAEDTGHRFTAQHVKTGSDENYSSMSITLQRSSDNVLIVTARTWGVDEAGPVLSPRIIGTTLRFVMLHHCGNIASKTMVPVSCKKMVPPDIEKKITAIQIGSLPDALVIYRDTAEQSK